jgi:hypothetical protein
VPEANALYLEGEPVHLYARGNESMAQHWKRCLPQLNHEQTGHPEGNPEFPESKEAVVA